MNNPAQSSSENPVKRTLSQDPTKRAKQLANLRPYRTSERAREMGKRGHSKEKVITAVLLAKMVRKRAKSVAEALIRQAEDGNVFAFNSLADRVEGKVAERIEVSGNVDLGLRIAAARSRRRLTETSEASTVDAIMVGDPAVQDTNRTVALEAVDWKDVAGD